MDRINQETVVNEKKSMRITRRDFISGPYKQCPNPECQVQDSFGVLTCIEGMSSYTRECTECGYQEVYDLPPINKKVIYLDQFVISNLIKLLDNTHPSHQKIMSDPFWESLFTKLEAASKSQAIVCPDSFYHLNESLTGKIDFKLMRRLYEHFSCGKTLYPSAIIERMQVETHFKGWLNNEKVKFDYFPEGISFKNLHTWSLGLRVSVNANPYPGEIEGLNKINALTKEQLQEIWTRWQDEGANFIDRVKEETLGFGKGICGAVQQFAKRREIAAKKIAAGEFYNFEMDDILPPLSCDIWETLFKITREYTKVNNLPDTQILPTIAKYLCDIDSLLEIPAIKINSVMFAGLAYRAANGKKDAPKSTVDVQFISSYLPYCDALFVDKESALLLKEFPKGTPGYLRLKEFKSQVFSLNNKNEFLDYLDHLIAEIPEKQIKLLKDIEGEDYAKPYWDIIKHEKQDK